jgi:exosortase H (IPTLxxWG-CTERM-specific)
MTRFFVWFVILLVTLFIAELTPAGQKYVVDPWTGLLADISAKIITTFDGDAIHQGRALISPKANFGVEIQAGCNGVEAAIILIAAVLAFPTTWRYKLAGLVIGLVAVQGLNLVRIISLFYIGQWNLDAFKFAHEYVWQALIMLDVLVVWLLWLRHIAKRENQADAINALPQAAA